MKHSSHADVDADADVVVVASPSSSRSPKGAGRRSSNKRSSLLSTALSSIEGDLHPTAGWRLKLHRLAVVFSSEAYILSLVAVLVAFFALYLFSLYLHSFLGYVTVASVHLLLVLLFLLDVFVVLLDHGFGTSLLFALDVYFVLLCGPLIFITQGGPLGAAQDPWASLRVLPLLFRSSSVRGFLSSSAPFFFGLCGSSTGCCAPPRPTRSSSEGTSYLPGSYASFTSHPSDVPAFRLVQLLRPCITPASIVFTFEEKEELKSLLLQICQHKLYTPSRALLPVVGVGRSKSAAEEDVVEFKKVAEAWALNKYGATVSSAAGNAPAQMGMLGGGGFDRRSTISGHRDLRGISMPPTFSMLEGMMPNSLQGRINTYIEELVDDWDFNVQQLNRISKGKPLSSLCTFFFNDQRYCWSDLLSTSEFQFELYVTHVEQTYGDNIYHSKLHAADVVQSVHYLLQLGEFSAKLTQLEEFSLMFAAIIHDYQHPGVTNAFLVKTGGDLALRYNDISVLENHHVASAYQLLQRNPSMNFLHKMNRKDQASLRETVIGLVLSTDLKSHFDVVSSMGCEIAALAMGASTSKPSGGGGGASGGSSDSYVTLMKICLKCADIGHPTKVAKVHLKWSRLIMREFFKQGDKEKDMGQSVSALCDSKQVDAIPNSQKGFINFLVRPLYTVFEEGLVAYSLKGITSKEQQRPIQEAVKSETALFFKRMDENTKLWNDWENNAKRLRAAAEAASQGHCNSSNAAGAIGSDGNDRNDTTMQRGGGDAVSAAVAPSSLQTATGVSLARSASQDKLSVSNPLFAKQPSFSVKHHSSLAAATAPAGGDAHSGGSTAAAALPSHPDADYVFSLTNLSATEKEFEQEMIEAVKAFEEEGRESGIAGSPSTPSRSILGDHTGGASALNLGNSTFDQRVDYQLGPRSGSDSLASPNVSSSSFKSARALIHKGGEASSSDILASPATSLRDTKRRSLPEFFSLSGAASRGKGALTTDKSASPRPVSTSADKARGMTQVEKNVETKSWTEKLAETAGNAPASPDLPGRQRSSSRL